MDPAVLQMLEDELEKPLPQEKPDTPLFHYTTADGLCGILKEKRIRATHFTQLNDRSEIQAGEARTEREAARLLDQAPPHNAVSQEFFKRFLEAFKVMRLSKTDVYVASFSEDGDLLSQWQLYGGSGWGYSLGLRSVPLPPTNPPDEMHMGVGLVRCKYDADAWQARAGQVLLEVADGLERYIRTYAETFEDDRSLGNRAITCAIRMIAAMVPTLKDNGFSAEREWRLIALPIDEHTPRLVEFRSRMPHGLVSYINLPLAEGDNNLDLTRVNIGPAQINSAPQRAANARRETALLLRKYRHQASLAHDSALTFWA